MLRKILAVLAGLFLGGLVVALVEYLGLFLYPYPEGTDYRDLEAMRTLAASQPAGAFVVVLAGWALGSFIGGFVAGRIAKIVAPAVVVGVIQLALGIFNMFTIPSPVWFCVVGCLLFLPSAWAGGALGAAHRG